MKEKYTVEMMHYIINGFFFKKKSKMYIEIDRSFPERCCKL